MTNTFLHRRSSLENHNNNNNNTNNNNEGILKIVMLRHILLILALVRQWKNSWERCLENDQVVINSAFSHSKL